MCKTWCVIRAPAAARTITAKEVLESRERRGRDGCLSERQREEVVISALQYLPKNSQARLLERTLGGLVAMCVSKLVRRYDANASARSALRQGDGTA